MIPEKLKIAWKLKDFAIKFDSIPLSMAATNCIHDFVEYYPKPLHRMIALVNNVVYGNVVYNRIIDMLLEKKKINSKATRISDFRNYEPQEHAASEVILLDNVEFSLMTDHEKNQLISLIESLLINRKLLFLNVADQNLDDAPRSLIHQFETGVTIGL